MKANKLLAGALALAITAVNIFSSVNLTDTAAAVKDKPMIDFELTGKHTEKKLSEADAAAINKAFGYSYGSDTVHICSADTAGYINWDNSSLDLWKVYHTRILQPDLFRDAAGNLVVEKDENGNVAYKYDIGLAVWAGSPSRPALSDGFYGFTILGKTVKDTKTMGDYYINSHLGEVYTDYDKTQKITDVYVIRVWYTTDEKRNWTEMSDERVLEDSVDPNRKKERTDEEDFDSLVLGNRTYGYTDIWILPEGVDTVLNLEDTVSDKTASGTFTSLWKGEARSFTAGKYNYQYTSASTVAFAGAASSKTKKVVIPKTVTYGGTTYKVTSIANSALKNNTKVTSVTIGANVKKIGASAFSGCKKLKTITIKSEKLTSVGKQAFKNISATAKIKVPKSKLAEYKKLLKGKGQGSKVRMIGV